MLRLQLEEQASASYWRNTRGRRGGTRDGEAPRRDTKEGQERAAASLPAKANSLQSNASLGSLPHTSSGPRCMAPVFSTAQQHTHTHRECRCCARFCALTPPTAKCRSGTGEEGKVGRGGCAGRSGRVCVRARPTDALLTAELTGVACHYSLLFVLVTVCNTHMATVTQCTRGRLRKK